MQVAVVRIGRCETDLVFNLQGAIHSSPSLAAIIRTLHIVDWGLFGAPDTGGDIPEDRLLGS
jgi:hypothetical protein